MRNELIAIFRKKSQKKIYSSTEIPETSSADFEKKDFERRRSMAVKIDEQLPQELREILREQCEREYDIRSKGKF